MTTPVNLRELAVDRSVTAPTSWRGKLGIRYGLPALIFLAFSGVLAWSLRDSLLPAKGVTVTPVIVARADVQQSDAPVFQAAGWIEPSPTANVVSAQAEGIVENLLVVAGEEVSVGQPIARLIDADARLAVSEAEATLRLREAELELTAATLNAAREVLEDPVHLEAALAEAEATLAKVTTESKNLPFAEQAAEARLQIARQELEAKQKLADVVAARTVQRAQSEFDAAEAAVNELRERRNSIQSEIESCDRKCDALRRQLELKTDERRKVEEAEAGLKIAEARRDQAQLSVDGAKLQLERMVIYSPIDGRVLAIHAQPGQRLVGLSPSSERDASAVVSLYDPKSLQIRADVRLEYLAQTQLGQPVEITTAALRAPLRGQVIGITSQADVQKNTLQVKVSIHDPPPLIKPEMLAQVTFFSAQQSSSGETNSETLRKLIPRQLVQGPAESSSVWIADLANNRARLQPIQLGRGQTGELIEVEKGLTPTSKLIVSGREGLRDGERIKVVGEDKSLGTQSATNMAPIASNDPGR